MLCVCGVCVYYNSIRTIVYDIAMKVMHHDFYSIMIDFKFDKIVKKLLKTSKALYLNIIYSVLYA